MPHNTNNNQYALVNRLLGKVLGPTHVLPALLTELGVSSEQIQTLLRGHVESFLQQILDFICAEVSDDNDEPRRHAMLLRYYGLATGRREHLQRIGQDYGISRERVRQLILLRLRTMKQPRYQQQLRTHVKQTALNLLGSAAP